MDKKKVIELIEKGISYLNRRYYIASYEQSAMECFKEAIQELSKSDWISVEDRLPEFNKEVLVTSKENPNGIWLSYRPSEKRPIMDKNGFSCPSYFNITHWKPIEKLEE